MSIENNTESKHLTYYAFPPSGDESKKVESLVIMLHGLGADGRDLLSLAPHFAQDLPDTGFIAPDAPFPCDMAPMGHQWFSLQDRSPEKMTEGVKSATPYIEHVIQQQMEMFGLPANKIALLGFSQGTMLSLYMAPRYKEQLAGVLGYSGALIDAENMEKEAKNKLPIQLIHGKDDDVVPYTVMDPAYEILKGLGFPVEKLGIEGLSHSIDQTGFDVGKNFLKSLLY